MENIKFETVALFSVTKCPYGKKRNNGKDFYVGTDVEEKECDFCVKIHDKSVDCNYEEEK